MAQALLSSFQMVLHGFSHLVLNVNPEIHQAGVEKSMLRLGGTRCLSLVDDLKMLGPETCGPRPPIDVEAMENL